MRLALWFIVFLLVLTGVAAPIVYWNAGRGLPQLETEFDLEKLLRNSIEGERMSLRFGQFAGDRTGIDWERPDFSRYPKDFVALYLVQIGCPGFFQSPREDGFRWAYRMALGLARVRVPGDGRCERYLAGRLAAAVGAESDLELTVAANRIHGFLVKDQLIAYDFASMRFERGLVGVEDAAKVLFKKPITELTLSQLAELALTLPGTDGLWNSLKSCKNASLIQQNRDVLLSLLAQHSLVSPEKARSAQAQRVDCVREY